MQRKRVTKTHEYKHNDTKPHNGPGDGIMQCCCGWVFNEIWSCLSVCHMQLMLSNHKDTEWVQTKQNKDSKGGQREEYGKVLMNK